jgi:uncharacterized membrane protein YgcG
MLGFKPRIVSNVRKPVSGPKPSFTTQTTSTSTAGASKAASTAYLTPILRGTRRRALPAQPYLFDALTAHPQQAVIQAHPASGFVYPWVPNAVKRGGGVPQGAPWFKSSTEHRTDPGLHTSPAQDYLSPQIQILTPVQPVSGGSGSPGQGGSGGSGPGGGGGAIGGGGGHALK